MGADFIELDVVSTKDHVLVTRHDLFLETSSNVADIKDFRGRNTTKADKDFENGKRSGYFVMDFTLKEIKRMRARQTFSFRDHSLDDQYEIPTLDEVLQVVKQARSKGKQVGVYIETKQPGFHNRRNRPLESLLVESLRESGLLHEPGAVYFQSFSMKSLKKIHKLLMNEDIKVPMTWLLDSRDPLPSAQQIAKFAEFGKAIGPDKTSLVEMDCGVHECNRRKKSLCSDFHFDQRCTGRLSRQDNGSAILSPLISLARDAGLELHAYTFRNEDMFMALDFLAEPFDEMDFFVNERNGIVLDAFFSDCPETAGRFLESICVSQDTDDSSSAKSWTTGITLLVVIVAFIVGGFILHLRHKKRKEMDRFIELASDVTPERTENSSLA